MSPENPVASPLSQQAAWDALAGERRWPARPGAVELRSARLLLVPFWRHHLGAGRVGAGRVGAGRGGAGGAAGVVSAADLLPIGLPPLGAQRTSLSGFAARFGYAAAAPDGSVSVDSTLPPPDGSWTPERHPMWAFHYVQHNKERFHVVDAVTGRAIGPARRFRPLPVAAAGAIAFAALFLTAWPLLRAAAVLPAWLLASGVTRFMLMKARADY